MRRYGKLVSIAAVLGLLAVACGGGGGGGAQPTGAKPVKGGTLRVEMDTDVIAEFDPQKEYYQVSFAYYRCCLLRTLLSYNGQDASHQGTQLFPDLASDQPTISADQLTWTFHLKQGLHYAPPLQDVEITAPDIVRALEREATPSVAAGYGFYYTDITGYSDFSGGKAKTISGLTTPDKYTLDVHLDKPAGDLGYRFALPATAPIPPNPNDPKALLGVAEGHDDDYGHFLVASGPYMFKGAEGVDFSQPASKQTQVPGYVPGKSIDLVRNPSWAQDDLRGAYVDEIQVQESPGADPTVLEKKVQSNEIDTVFENSVDPTTLQAYTTNEQLKPLLHQNPSPSNFYIFMNLAVPPFDDIHVRKAMEYAIDKEGLRRIGGGPITGEIAGHFVPDGLLTTSNGTQVLASYDPYATPGSLGADSPDGLTAAKNEMMQSKYDTNHDGVCDADVCKNILAINSTGRSLEAEGSLIAQNAKAIGIELNVRALSNSAAYGKILDPKAHIAIATFAGWLEDYPDAFTFFYATMYGPNILSQYNTNYSLVGATPAQLKQYGYTVSSVPSMDAQITKCIPLTGDDRVNCWAEADRYLMEQVVPIVPWIFSNVVNIVSNRVQNYTYSYFDSQTAYDQISLAPGSS
jgi:peptide/nickel transport system substrate-binding protein